MRRHTLSIFVADESGIINRVTGAPGGRGPGGGGGGKIVGWGVEAAEAAVPHDVGKERGWVEWRALVAAALPPTVTRLRPPAGSFPGPWTESLTPRSLPLRASPPPLSPLRPTLNPPPPPSPRRQASSRAAASTSTRWPSGSISTRRAGPLPPSARRMLSRRLGFTNSLSFSYRTPRHRLVILSTWVGSDSPLPWLLSEVTQVVVWRAMLALSGNATGFSPTGVVWLKTFQRD